MRICRGVYFGLVLFGAVLPGACTNPSGSAIAAAGVHMKGAVAAAPDAAAADPRADNYIESKVMLSSSCCAGSPMDKEAAGGFWRSDNDAKPVNASCSGKGLYLLAQPDVVMKFSKEKGMRLVLVNQTSEFLAFKASDSRLSIVQEAVDAAGAWKPVEYLEQSHCGNSYHRIFLSPHTFWEFATRRYSGPVKTQMRYTLTLSDGTLLHSNTFEGSINPEQFTNKE